MDEKDVAEAFSRDGFVVLSKALPPDVLGEWQAFADEYFQRCFVALHQMGHTRAPVHQVSEDYVLGLGAKHGFKEIVMRSPGRYELSLLNLDEDELANTTNMSVTIPETKPILECLGPTILPMLLGNNENKSQPRLCHLSLLVATPGSADQGWHADGGHLSVLEHLPCHCFNIFIPLQDVAHPMGPTEFRPGGHYLTRNLAPMMLAAKCRNTLRKPVWPALAFGDVVMFDYRVLHRGRANQSNRNRNVLVFTFCQPWFEDILNFPKRSMLQAPSTDGEDDEVPKNEQCSDKGAK